MDAMDETKNVLDNDDLLGDDAMLKKILRYELNIHLYLELAVNVR